MIATYNIEIKAFETAIRIKGKSYFVRYEPQISVTSSNDCHTVLCRYPKRYKTSFEAIEIAEKMTIEYEAMVKAMYERSAQYAMEIANRLLKS